MAQTNWSESSRSSNIHRYSTVRNTLAHSFQCTHMSLITDCTCVPALRRWFDLCPLLWDTWGTIRTHLGRVDIQTSIRTRLNGLIRVLLSFTLQWCSVETWKVATHEHWSVAIVSSTAQSARDIFTEKKNRSVADDKGRGTPVRPGCARVV